MANLQFDFAPDIRPLAARLRPISLEHYFGQQHILAEGQPLRKAIEQGHCHSLILWGPPGTGKTTLAEIIARYADMDICRISAVTSGVKEIREAVASAKGALQQHGRKTLLFVDEVHRFNKSQQDAFLPHIEEGTFTFIGATTENPSFALNNALLSRARVYVIKPLEIEDLYAVLEHALEDKELGLGKQDIQMELSAKKALCRAADGDARKLLNLLELAADLAEPLEKDSSVNVISERVLTQVLPAHLAKFDRGGDEFYDLISAFHKSVRGSSPDGALYWYCRILVGGGDPLYVARRLLAIATEDIGNADPRAMQVALNAWDIFQRVGPAEGERAIAQAAIYLAAAPKSNAVYNGFKQAKRLAAEQPSYPVPNHLRNAPTSLMKSMGMGDDYRYAHNETGAYAAGESYFPPEIKETQFYHPTDRGLEAKISEKLKYLSDLDSASPVKRYDDI